MKNNYLLVVLSGILSVVAISMEQLAYQSEKTLVKLDEEKIEWTYKKEYFIQLNEHLIDLDKYLGEIELYLISYDLKEEEKTNLHERAKLKLYNILKELPNNTTFSEIMPLGFNDFLFKFQFSEKSFTELYEADESLYDHLGYYPKDENDFNMFQFIMDTSYDEWYAAMSQIPEINKKQNKVRSLRQVWLIFSMTANILSLIALFLFFKNTLRKGINSSETTA